MVTFVDAFFKHGFLATVFSYILDTFVCCSVFSLIERKQREEAVFIYDA